MRDRWIYPGADEPTIGITMPMTDKPLRRDRYRVRCEQKNEIGRVRRDNTRRGYISVYGSHSLRLLYTDRLHRPRRRESRRALRSSASPEIHGSPARHFDTLASPPSECRHSSFCHVEQPQKSSRLMPGAGSPDRYRGATCSSQARLYKAPTLCLICGSRITRNRPSLHVSAARGAHTRFEDLADQFVRYGVRLQPPHRAGGGDDFEQISVLVFVRHGVLTGARSGSAEELSARIACGADAEPKPGDVGTRRRARCG